MKSHFRERYTKPEQFNTIVDFMMIHEELAKGYLKTVDARQRSADLWEVLRSSLNAQGPPLKNVEGWKKVSNNKSIFIIHYNYIYLYIFTLIIRCGQILKATLRPSFGGIN